MLASYNKRNRSQAPSNRHENMELNTFQDPFKFQMNIFKEFDNFSNQIFGKMERNFGFDMGMGMGMGMGRMMERFSRMADFDAMGDFSDMHEHMMRGNDRGTVIQKSYVSSTRIDENGRRVEEKYFNNNIAQRGEDGNTISERREGYKNSGLGIKRIAQERMLNDKGRKYIQERNELKNEERSHDVYYNIRQEEKDDFDRHWNNHNQNTNFLSNNLKFIQPNASHRYLRDDPSTQFKRNSRNTNFEREDDGYEEYNSPQKKYKNENQQNYHPKARASDLQPVMLGKGNSGRNINIQNLPALPADERYTNDDAYVSTQNLNRNNFGGNKNTNATFRNKKEQAAGLFRNKAASKNSIPKAG